MAVADRKALSCKVDSVDMTRRRPDISLSARDEVGWTFLQSELLATSHSRILLLLYYDQLQLMRLGRFSFVIV